MVTVLFGLAWPPGSVVVCVSGDRVDSDGGVGPRAGGFIDTRGLALPFSVTSCVDRVVTWERAAADLVPLMSSGASLPRVESSFSRTVFTAGVFALVLEGVDGVNVPLRRRKRRRQ